ncbi:transcriptional regulator [Frankia sp. CNm7]|uniref:Transcriptional regulator n=1 Tax=Frankia nepalensis TaxID=1836974 RepID=A0A937UP53_9ACTN|nr:helix-turn-helix domain-containing protein [Frankia nepalensis]MBL7496127.1 transcriptional regulator [Frankia nepalensis]MBL7508934.1 transcriptional regulator [Frankia nepalensis]MBL7516774.1 transcriptional regulator [Frankia nepalensis]MBL7628712.1 transcriptional regulator [Frankia nepalensis]
MDTEVLVADALLQLRVEAQPPASRPDGRVDLVVDPEGAAVPVELKRRSLVSEDIAAQLLAVDREPAGAGGAVLLVVGDRVTEAARRMLIERRAGYYDLRGRIALRSSSLVIDAEVTPIGERGVRTRALGGKAGLEVAIALLLQPKEGAAVRELARSLGRSASTVSQVLAALRRDQLVDSANAVVDARLFWQVAEQWPSTRTFLTTCPDPDDQSGVAKSLRLGLADLAAETGWALTDTTAAAAYGAPVAARADQALDFFVPDEVVLRRATTLLGTTATPTRAAASVRAAPVAAVCARRFDLPGGGWRWPLAHPLFVALDLAQDEGRGREILDAWNPDPRWTRAW